MLADLAGSSACDIVGRAKHIYHPDLLGGELCRLRPMGTLAWLGAQRYRYRRAAFYRRKAARARQVAEGMVTRAMKAKPLEDASHCDRLNVKADRSAEEAARF